MANDAFYERIGQELADIDAQGLTKRERVLLSPQGAQVRVATPNGERDVLNLCANNYLGLASDERVVEAAIRATRDWGAGLASVRFICGTQLPHKQLEAQMADLQVTLDEVREQEKEARTLLKRSESKNGA